jgi:hypothetical protein
MPARREISAREIGAPARIVSSTVRSFMSFRSGGSATLAILVSNLTALGRKIELDFGHERVVQSPRKDS